MIRGVGTPRYVAGLDLGQAQDYTALVVGKPSDEPEPILDIGHVERIPLGTRYPDIVRHVGAIVDALRRPVPFILPAGVDYYELGYEKNLTRPDVTLVVDYTGVGRPVADMLIEAQLDCDLILVTITSGTKVTRDENGLHVPKRELASVIQRLLQESRLRIAAGLPMAEVLTGELANFRVTISASGHDSYGAGDDWRAGNHDDLVLALALSAWWSEHTMTVGIY